MRRAGCLIGWVVAAVLAGCAPSDVEEPPPAGAPSPTASVTEPGDEEVDLWLDFDDVPPAGLLDQTRNRGAADVSVEGISFTGAPLPLEVGLDGGQAVRFPVVSAPPAVVTVASTGSDDPLTPGDAPFRFAADIRLDSGAGAEVEAGAGGQGGTAAEDNGNNVVQRGLFGDDAQYKIQVDQGRASCRLQGDRGDVLVKADTAVPAETWTRLECSRQGRRVELTQEVLEGPDAGQQEVWTAQAVLGPINFDGRAPIAIGGKITAKGGVVSGNSDQFNGSIDNVLFDVSG